jgi:hypothetical protein
MMPSQSKPPRQLLRFGVGREELAPLNPVGLIHRNPMKVLNCGTKLDRDLLEHKGDRPADTCGARVLS